MPLSQYHQKYASEDKERNKRRIEVKKEELEKVFKVVPFKTKNKVVKIAVWGCGEARIAKAHKKIFREVLGQPVRVTTFDISIEHLKGVAGVVKHDCTLPLPNGPYDITYAHVLLKFIPTEKQWGLIKNSYDALAPGGLALHFLDEEDYKTGKKILSDGYFGVTLYRWLKKLKANKIKFKKIPLKIKITKKFLRGLAIILMK